MGQRSSRKEDGEGEGEGLVGEHRPSCCLRFIKLYARLTGMFTVAALWSVAVYQIQDRDNKEDQWLPWYLVAAAIVVTFFEILWIINKCACCAAKEGACCACWKFLLWLDDWRRFLMYVCLAGPMLTRGFSQPLPMLCGFLVIFTANLYMIKTFYKPTKSTKFPKQMIPTKTPTVSMVTTNVSTQTEQPKYKVNSQHTTTVDLTSTSETATLTSDLEGKSFDGADLAESVAQGESYMFID